MGSKFCQLNQLFVLPVIPVKGWFHYCIGIIESYHNKPSTLVGENLFFKTYTVQPFKMYRSNR